MADLGFLYFGRLEEEKGFGDLIHVLEYFLEGGKKLPFDIFVFGEGKYENKIKDLAEKCKKIHYFGYKSLKTIYRYVENCDFCLMPSRVIESYGLSALNSLSRGLPVVGYKKGGLERFVFDELDLGKMDGDSYFDRLLNFFQKTVDGKFLSKHELKDLYHKGIKIADELHEVEWERKVGKMLIPPTLQPPLAGEEFSGKYKILLVSDFVSKIGGIETHVLASKDLLENMGYEVEVIGKKIQSGIVGKILKIWGVSFLANFNLVFAVKLFLKIIKFNPDIVRCHSVLRWIGWLPLAFMQIPPSPPLSRGECKVPKLWWTVHDLGYFYPLPSSLEEVSELKFPLCFGNFCKMFTPPNLAASSKIEEGVLFLKKILLLPKFLNMLLLKKTIKKSVDKIIVPSEFLEEIVQKSYGVEKKKIKVVEHFLS